MRKTICALVLVFGSGCGSTGKEVAPNWDTFDSIEIPFAKGYGVSLLVELEDNIPKVYHISINDPKDQSIFVMCKDEGADGSWDTKGTSKVYRDSWLEKFHESDENLNRIVRYFNESSR